MSLNVYLSQVCPHCQHSYNWDFNITHNLNKMADKAGIYSALWCPDEVGITKAFQLIQPLREGLAKMKADPEFFKKYDSPNGWGLYEDFVPLVEGFLKECEEHPQAEVSVSK